jgi:hypothetical protein
LTEKKTTIQVPEAYLPLVADIRLLKSDEQNPNKMTLKQQEQIWQSLQKYGWVYPIVADRDGVFADGEQRVDVCKNHEEYFAPVLRLKLSDLDRRLLRQITNKLKGKHNRKMDETEYYKIIDMGAKKDLESLLNAIGEKLPGELHDGGGSMIVPESYELILGLKDESHQKKLLELIQIAMKAQLSFEQQKSLDESLKLVKEVKVLNL